MRAELVDFANFDLQIERYRWIAEQFVERLAPGSLIADVGSAPGHVAMLLSKLGFQVVAYDFLPEADLWESAPEGGFKQQLTAMGIKLVHWDVEIEDPQKLPPVADSGKFAGVVFSEVLEHIYRYPFASLLQVCQLLAASGVIVLTTPNRGYLTFRLKALAGRPIDNDLELHKDHFPPHMRHVHLYSLRDVEEMFAACRVEPVVSEVKSFHMFVKTPEHRSAVVGSSALRQILKLPLALVVSVLPGLGSSLCLVGKKLDRP